MCSTYTKYGLDMFDTHCVAKARNYTVLESSVQRKDLSNLVLLPGGVKRRTAGCMCVRTGLASQKDVDTGGWLDFKSCPYSAGPTLLPSRNFLNTIERFASSLNSTAPTTSLPVSRELLKGKRRKYKS